MKTESKHISQPLAKRIAEVAKEKGNVKLPESEYIWGAISLSGSTNNGFYSLTEWEHFKLMKTEKALIFNGKPHGYPAYSWQEILIEYPKFFFGEEIIKTPPNHSDLHAYIYHAKAVLCLLIHNNTEEAEKYFLRNIFLEI